MPKQKDTTVADDEKPAFEDAALGFVYKSLISRDPNKRRIKPVESILSYDPALDESESDDSDYNPAHVEDDDAEVETDCEEDKTGDKSAKSMKKGTKKNGQSEQNGNQKDSSSSDSSSDDSSDEDDDEHDDNLDDFDLDANSITNNTLAKSELLLSSSSHMPPTNGIDSTATNATKNSAEVKLDPVQAQQSRLKKILLCCVCLGEVSRNDDEIVECDSCGISVHELCYGITVDDAESVHSDASSASTEPWFCDPCKADIKSPLCELCPNSGGIFKITNSGRWVHMVCALYTHGITFADPERLRGPVLTNIHYNRWGSKPCSLCEDERFSHTGVATCCDAGMCKTFFHVTCAQREGLLCPQRSDEVDPYIVYCKLHCDRDVAKLKRRNYLALVAKNRMVSRALPKNASIEDGITSERTLSKLASHRKKFVKNFPEIGNLSKEKDRRCKMLIAAPTVLRRLNSKGQLLGFNSARNERLGLNTLTDIRRKWYIQPAFSVEFVSYYLDRNDRMVSMQKQFLELIRQNTQLKDMEAKIRAKYDHMFAMNEQVKAENELKRAQIRNLLSSLGSFMNDPEQVLPEFAPTSSLIAQEDQRIKRLKIGSAILSSAEMQIFKVKPHFSVPSTIATSNPAPITHSIPKSPSSNSSSKLKSTKSTTREEDIKFKQCATCLLTKDQHTLALCDRCHLYYHLYCLDPPLRRMPKKTRFGGWQCSNCTEKDQEEEEQNGSALERAESANSSNPSAAESPNVAMETSNSNSSRGGTRKLRENPKSALKYEEEVNSQLAIFSSGGSLSSGGSGTSTRGRPRGRTSGANTSGNGNNTSSGAANNKKTTTSRRGRKPKVLTATADGGTKTPQPSEVKGRKRKLSFVQANSTMVVEDDSQLASIETTNSNNGNSGPSLEAATISTNVALPEQLTPVLGSKSAPAHASAGHGTTSKRPIPSENCNGCKKETQPKHSVRCDNCAAVYHLCCLQPPVTKSPKRRGYTWCCFVCEKNAEKREHSHAHHETAEKAKAADKVAVQTVKYEQMDNAVAGLGKVDVKASGVLSASNGKSDVTSKIKEEEAKMSETGFAMASTSIKAELENGTVEKRELTKMEDKPMDDLFDGKEGKLEAGKKVTEIKQEKVDDSINKKTPTPLLAANNGEPEQSSGKVEQ